MAAAGRDLPWRVWRTRVRYALAVGDEALKRQRAEARLRFACCYALRSEGHAAGCRYRWRRKRPAQPELG